jgi:flagellar basal-body rod modification protein FlgD
VTGIQEMQGAFATLSASMRSSQVLDGATMIGREVLVAGDAALLSGEGAIEGAVDVPAGASSVQINVVDDAGQLVRRMPATGASGLTDFSWDGVTDEGVRAQPGQYHFEAIANVGGQAVSLEVLLESRVNSVTIDGARGLMLNTSSLGVRALSDVRRVM